jgi:beta-lactamase regulating signal transducer with metallopeptidase domain
MAVSAAIVQFIWQGAAVALLYWLLDAAFRKSSAQTRYLTGCGALAFMAALPPLTAWHLYWPASSGGSTLARMDWTLPLWCAGVLICSIRPLRSLARIRLLRRNGLAAEQWIRDRSAAVATRMGCTRIFRVLICAMSETPSTIGWLRPAILLPAATIAGLTPDQLEAILAHEIAHIRRHDYLVNMIQVAIETLLFYHPAVWWISSRIRFERELCCDDDAVRATGQPLAYARTLTTLERLRTAEPAPALSSVGGPLSYRVRRLTGQPQPAQSHWPALTLSLMLLAVGVNWVHAQESQDKVAVEVTRDEQGSITNVRVLSGPEYLRPLALSAALQQPVQPVRSILPPEQRVRTFTFPDAFQQMASMKALVRQFLTDRILQAEAAGESARAAELRRQLDKTSDIKSRYEKMWKVQTLRHRLTGHRDSDANYSATQQALAEAEADLANSTIVN